MIVPWQIRESVRRLLAQPARRKALRRFRSIKASEGGIRLGFGGVLDDGRPVHGGAVKLLPLREAFGGDERAFNVLYAVSSSQPAFAEDLFLACKEKGIRVVWNQNGVGYPAWAGRESERFNGPMRRLRGLSDFVVYQSAFCEESAARFLGECAIPSARLYNPVDTVRFRPREGPRGGGPVRLLAAGTHGTRDRVMNVLQAVHALGSEVSLTVAGRFQWRDGEADFEAEAKRFGIRVKRVRTFSQADAAEMYRGHDVLVHPKYMDPCPTVVLEALACGLPVVGSATGGMPELVDDSCGRLVQGPKDWDVMQTPGPGELAGAIQTVLSELPSLAAGARRRAVERFSVGPWVEAHRGIFEKLAG